MIIMGSTNQIVEKFLCKFPELWFLNWINSQQFNIPFGIEKF